MNFNPIQTSIDIEIDSISEIECLSDGSRFGEHNIILLLLFEKANLENF